MTTQRRPRKRASDWQDDIRRAERSAWWLSAAITTGWWAAAWLVIHFVVKG